MLYDHVDNHQQITKKLSNMFLGICEAKSEFVRIETVEANLTVCNFGVLEAIMLKDFGPWKKGQYVVRLEYSVTGQVIHDDQGNAVLVELIPRSLGIKGWWQRLLEKLGWKS